MSFRNFIELVNKSPCIQGIYDLLVFAFGDARSLKVESASCHCRNNQGKMGNYPFERNMHRFYISEVLRFPFLTIGFFLSVPCFQLAKQNTIPLYQKAEFLARQFLELSLCCQLFSPARKLCWL